MKSTIHVIKPVGYTPLEIIRIFKDKNPEYSQAKIGYAGRLDPMAEGVLILLINEENKRKQLYEDYEKEYECEILFGLATDSYDVMGILTQKPRSTKLDTLRLSDLIHQHKGKQLQSYPPYSSIAVQGKPLYYWARRNMLHTISIPTREIDIHIIKLLSLGEITSERLHKTVYERITKVKGDFRQQEILFQWEEVLAYPYIFQVAKMKVTCTSGTYVRSIAHSLGLHTQSGALALSIKRTRVGPYTSADALRLL